MAFSRADRSTDLELNRDREGLQPTYLQDDDTSRPLSPPLKGKGITEKAKIVNNQPQPRSRLPFGLRPLAFGLLIALITAVVVGAAVGGGVGKSLASSSSSKDSLSPSNTSQSSPTPTARASSASATSAPASSSTTGPYQPPAPSTISRLALTCPSTPLHQFALASDPFPTQTFRWKCNYAYAGNGRGVKDVVLVEFPVYRPEDCVDACGNYNSWQRDFVCTAVRFSAHLSLSWNDARGNCWLFNGTLGGSDSDSDIGATLDLTGTA